jgi:hypothetical protein
MQNTAAKKFFRQTKNQQDSATFPYALNQSRVPLMPDRKRSIPAVLFPQNGEDKQLNQNENKTD